MTTAALALLAALLFPAMAHAAVEASFLDAVVEAYGGADAVKRLEAFRVEAEVDSTMQGATGKVRRDFQAPDRLRVEIDYPAAKEVRVLSGEKGWRGDAGQLKRVQGPPFLSMVYQMLRATVPESLVRHRDRLEDRGTRTEAGAEYRVIELAWSQELGVSFLVEPRTHRVIWVKGSVHTSQMETSFATQYGDFRSVNGVVFPFLEENYASGQHTGSTRVRRVDFGPKDLGPFDPTKF